MFILNVTWLRIPTGKRESSSRLPTSEIVNKSIMSKRMWDPLDRQMDIVITNECNFEHFFVVM